MTEGSGAAVSGGSGAATAVGTAGGAATVAGGSAAAGDEVGIDWGYLYAAAPNRGVVRKFSPDLTPVAELKDALSRPRGFHVPFVNVRDHRAGSVTRVGRPNGVTVDQWTNASGMRLWGLGVDVVGLGLVQDGGPAARFTLTDPAEMTLEIADARDGRTLVRRSVGAMAAGVHTVPLTVAAGPLRSACGTGVAGAAAPERVCHA